MSNYISTISYAFMTSTGTILLEFYFKDLQSFDSTFYLSYIHKATYQLVLNILGRRKIVVNKATYQEVDQLRLKHGTLNNGYYILLTVYSQPTFSTNL